MSEQNKAKLSDLSSQGKFVTPIPPRVTPLPTPVTELKGDKVAKKTATPPVPPFTPKEQKPNNEGASNETEVRAIPPTPPATPIAPPPRPKAKRESDDIHSETGTARPTPTMPPIPPASIAKRKRVRVKGSSSRLTQTPVKAPVAATTHNKLPPIPPAMQPHKTDVSEAKEAAPLVISNQNIEPINDESTTFTELAINISAAKSLTSLIAALSIKDGMGPEVSAAERKNNIKRLIEKSHLLADHICHSVVESKRKGNVPIPNALHGVILQEASKHIAYQWLNEGDLEAQNMRLIASELFNSESQVVDQRTVGMFSQKGKDYQDENIDNDLRLQQSLINTALRIDGLVNSMAISDFIEGNDEEAMDMRALFSQKNYLFGKPDSTKITQDLMQSVVAIAEKNKINTQNEEINISWNTNLLYRAADLVRSEYKMYVERLIRVSLRDYDVCEQALNNNNSTYDEAIRNIESRASNSLKLILQSARSLMQKPPSLVRGNNEQPQPSPKMN